jgi:hypothetical protein
MRVSFIRSSQNSSGFSDSGPGLKPRNAFSNPGHLFSITLQAKPAQNTRLVISGENPVVAEPGERLRVGLGRQQLGERLGAALALFGPGANGLERGHGVRPPLNDG